MRATMKGLRRPRPAGLAARLTAAAVLLLAPVPAGAFEGPFPFADDHFLCYRGRVSSGSPSAAGTQELTLTDQFEESIFDIGKERGSCNPADKNGEGIVDADTHLTAYQIKALKSEPRHVRQTNVRVANQFGELFLDTVKPDRILVPAAKDDNALNPLPTPPVASAHAVDHYKCYKVRVSKGTAKFAKGVQASVEDQWESPARVFDLRKPKVLCLAVDKNGEGIKNTYASQLCYQAKPTAGQPKHTRRKGVGFADQLIAHRLDSASEEMLCVPSMINAPAEFCGDLVINQAGQEDCDGDSGPCAEGEICTDACRCAAAQARCGNGIIEPAYGETCEADGDCGSGQACTTSCTCMDAQCPDVMQWTRFAGFGSMVTGNGYDSGYTGIAHNNEVPDLSILRLRLSQVSGSGPASCGVATIAGIDPSSGLCRCADDNRQTCDQPLDFDFDDCGGAACTCYLDPPISTVSSGFPTCNLTRFVDDVTGTWNLDSGQGTIVISTEQTAHNGELQLKPCPSCDGDTALNDGVRDGFCSGGRNHGQPCDAQHTDPTFPAPGGGSFSLDCFPTSPPISTGIFVAFDMSTGPATLTSSIPCGFGSASLCPCGVCAGDGLTPCTGNADCGAVGPCATAGSSRPIPNNCTDGLCADVGNGEGLCLTAPPKNFCDALLRADGSGLIPCTTNADCTPAANDGNNAGTCSLQESAPCFPDTISVNGNADPVSPTLVSAVCTGPSQNNPGANLVAGYPGPGVRRETIELDLPCAGDHGAGYPACP